MSLESGEAAAALTPEGGGGETRAGSNQHGGGGGGGGGGGRGGGEIATETKGKVAVMNVEGMTCVMCVGIVENLVNRCVFSPRVVVIAIVVVVVVVVCFAFLLHFAFVCVPSRISTDTYAGTSLLGVKSVPRLASQPLSLSLSR